MPSSLTVVFVSQQLATPALIFWLWLVILPATMATMCPEKCWCDERKYRVVCPMSSMNNITSVHLKDVREFQLAGNSTSSLKTDTFISKGLTELVELSLNRCGLERIEVRAFSGLTKLTYLSLRRNKLRAIIPGTFGNLSNLQHLDLGYNMIGHLDVDVFLGLFNLNYVHLTSNKLTSVPPEVFLRLPTLEIVYLSKNYGLQIPTDRHFISSRSLRRLDISECNISSVSVETLANVSALEWLDLSHNNLRSVDINILKVLPKLSALYLYDNQLQCDCQLQEVWRWCQDHDIETVHEGTGPHCVIPSQGNGLPWVVLKERQCLQDNIRNHVDYEHKRYKRAEDEYKIYINFREHVQIPLYASLFIFGVISNVILLIIFICNKELRTDPNTYVLNLVISDVFLLTLILSSFWAGRISGLQYVPLTLVVLMMFCYRFSLDLLAYTVTMLSIQRYRLTVSPFHVRVTSQPTWRVLVTEVDVVWIVAALFALPSPVFLILVSKFLTLDSIMYYKYVVLFELLVSCVLPLCVIAFSYIMTARRHVDSSCSISEGTQHPQLNTSSITAKVVLGLTVVFLISYVPYHALITYCIFNSQGERYDTVLIFNIAICFLLINCCLNPVALFCTSTWFREHFKRYLTCCCKANSPSNDLELTTRN